MFLELQSVDVYEYPAGLMVINTDQIAYYYEHTDKTTMIHFSNGGGIEFHITKKELDDILLCNNINKDKPVLNTEQAKEIDNIINGQSKEDNPLGFTTESFDIDNNTEPNNTNHVRMATEKQVLYIKDLKRKKNLSIEIPEEITFDFAKKFLDKYSGKKSQCNTEIKPPSDEDDGEYPGYR